MVLLKEVNWFILLLLFNYFNWIIQRFNKNEQAKIVTLDVQRSKNPIKKAHLQTQCA
ncbi:hypothetical protein PULV_b0316 [Pseudoalteromonas ulvae UL12]|nr:hypothetical protein [Pseudoalteromonas ulvae UL12]